MYSDENIWLNEKINSLTHEKITLSVSENAEKIIIIPKGTAFPGPLSFERTPYLIEPINSFSEQSNIEFEVWLKGHQLGFTLGVECIIVYIIKRSPGPILYTTGSDSLAKEWSENRFDPMIEQAGMSNMIFSQTKKKKSKKTGDKTLLKEFPGGRIKMAGYGSTTAFKSSSFRFYFGDEIEEASADLKNQGNALEQAEGRTSAFKSKRKIVLFSTPIEEDESNIWPAYLLGDQRKYFVPCPFCGFMQVLEFDKLVYERDKDGILDIDSVKYLCQGEECDESFFNHHKSVMYSTGKCEWRATEKPKRANYISRQISCLYSPPGMITWSDIVQKYLDALDSGDPGKMKTFVTLYLGMPYKEKGEAPEYEKVISHKSGYPSKTVPDDVLFLTLGADVQGDRIELEICGHGRKYKTWSIDYVVIKGDTANINSGAWPIFREKFLDGEFVYQGEKGKYAPQMAFIDSNYRTDTVVEFCETVSGLFPIAGKDKFSDTREKFRIKNAKSTVMMDVILATNYLKDMVYNSLNTIHTPGQETPVNYPSFPYDYDDKYFKMLNAEYKRRVIKGKKKEWEYYCPKGRRNEALDCRVYNIGAREVLYYLIMSETLAESVEAYEQKVKRKILVAEKVEFFFGYMEKAGVFS